MDDKNKTLDDSLADFYNGITRDTMTSMGRSDIFYAMGGKLITEQSANTMKTILNIISELDGEPPIEKDLDFLLLEISNDRLIPINSFENERKEHYGLLIEFYQRILTHKDQTNNFLEAITLEFDTFEQFRSSMEPMYDIIDKSTTGRNFNLSVRRSIKLQRKISEYRIKKYFTENHAI